MNYKHKRIKIAVHRYFESGIEKVLLGKVISIHTAQGIRDTSTINLLLDNGKIAHYPTNTHYFTIIGEK